MAFFSKKMNQFAYFATQLDDWSWQGKDVLDFGGNIGNILRDPRCTIDEERYWCIDVDREAIERGRLERPRSHFLFYDRYCFFFNPNGTPRLALPRLDRRFDYILAYSVFTNTLPSEMVDLVAQLEALLGDDGKLAFTFIDPNHRSWPDRYPGGNLAWRVEMDREEDSDVDVRALVREARDAKWSMLVNGRDLYLETEAIGPYADEEHRTCHAFHTVRYVASLFPDALILPPANDEMQHCCIISASASASRRGRAPDRR